MGICDDDMVMEPCSPELPLLLKAARFAAEKHRHQRRKGSEYLPYINHPIEVAEMLINIGEVTAMDILATALLHDTLEDTDTTRDELRVMFGDRIVGLVLECTDDKSLPQAERKRLQIEHAAHMSFEAKQIKIADKISNVQDLGRNPPVGWSLQRRLEYLDWSERVMAGLRGANPALEKLYDDSLAKTRQQVLSDAHAEPDQERKED